MRLLIKLLTVAFVIAISAASCSDFLNKEKDGPELVLKTAQAQNQTTTFNGDTLVFIPIETKEPPSDYNFPEFTSKVHNNQIIINGYYLASSDFAPEGVIEQEDNTIKIRIRMPKHIDFVLNEPKGYLYNAYISNLSNKKFTVEIVHRNDGLRSGSRDKDITVFTKEFVIE
ncbi:MAG: hypothetical protein JXR26_02085 [Balneolaceae bacterium]|nr:hypothetical protein [Balneolaceae bacterium]